MHDDRDTIRTFRAVATCDCEPFADYDGETWDAALASAVYYRDPFQDEEKAS